MKKEYLLVVVSVLLVWSVKDRLPSEYQFWKRDVTVVTIQNHSSQDLQDVALVVFSTPYQVGTIKKDTDKTVSARRIRESTEVVIRFVYGSEVVERHVGTLGEARDHQMTIIVTLGGAVVVQDHAETPEGNGDDKPSVP